MAELTAINGTNKKNLQLKSNIKPGVLEFNYDILKDALQSRLGEYKSLVVTEDTLDGCKNAKSELVSFRTTLENFRKEKKGECEKPIKEFDRQVKDLIGMVTDAEKPLDKSLDVFAEKARQKKKEFAGKHIAEAAEAHGLREPFAKRILLKKEFLNASITQKAVKADINAQAEALRREQDEYDKNLSVIRETVDSENSRIQIKMDPEEYISEFERGTDILSVIKKIKKRADDIFRQEARLEKERLEKERLENERIEKELLEKKQLAMGHQKEVSMDDTEDGHQQMKTAASQCAISPSPVFSDTEGRDAQSFDTDNIVYNISQFTDEFILPAEIEVEKSAEGSTGEKSGNSDNSAGPADAEMPFQKEKVFEVKFCVKGGFSTLRSLNNYLKEKGIEFSVDSQREI